MKKLARNALLAVTLAGPAGMAPIVIDNVTGANAFGTEAAAQSCPRTGCPPDEPAPRCEDTGTCGDTNTNTNTNRNDNRNNNRNTNNNNNSNHVNINQATANAPNMALSNGACMEGFSVSLGAAIAGSPVAVSGGFSNAVFSELCGRYNVMATGAGSAICVVSAMTVVAAISGNLSDQNVGQVASTAVQICTPQGVFRPRG